MATNDRTSFRKYLTRAATGNIIRVSNVVLRVRKSPYDIVWIVDRHASVGGWQSVLTKEQKRKCDRILGAFGLEKIYSGYKNMLDAAAASRFVKEHKVGP
jgi:hypothetical protein